MTLIDINKADQALFTEAMNELLVKQFAEPEFNN